MAESRSRIRLARRPHGQAGHALLSALIATALLLPLGAFAVLQARLDFLVQHHTRAASEALAIAEAGLEQALADFARDPRFERLTRGPDGQAGTGDDGVYPFASEPPAFFPAAPRRYEVRVAALAADRVEIVSRGYGVLGSVRGVAAAVLRATVPVLPGAVATDAPRPDLLLGPDLHVAGAAGDGEHPDVPALAVQDSAVATQLAARLTAEEKGRLTGPGGPPSIGVAPVPDLGRLFDAARDWPGATTLIGEARGSLGTGVFTATGTLRLDEVGGSGLLLVDGPLEVTGPLTFDGLIAVRGDVRIAAEAELALTGALLQGAPGGTLLLRGSGWIRYDARIAERLASDFPGLLPVRARVTGWRELPEPGR